MAFKVLQEWSNRKYSKTNSRNISKDDAYVQSVIKDQLNKYKNKYLNEKGKTVDNLIFEIKPEYVDSLIYLISNTNITDFMTFKQIKPTLFEIRQKHIPMF